MNSPPSEMVSPNSLTRNNTFTSKSGERNSHLFGKDYYSVMTSELNNDFPESNLPLLVSQPSPASDSHLLLTKPKLLRKKDSEIKHYRKLVLKKSLDCANAISGEQLAMAREKALKRKLQDLKSKNKVEKQVEKLQNKERLLNETEQFRWQRDEAHMQMAMRDSLIQRLRMRVTQLENLEKQKEKDLNLMKQEIDTKNTALKNLLRKLVLAQFTKKKS